MKIQHSTIIENEKTNALPQTKAEHKKYGFVSVTAGEGLADIFKDYGVDEIIEGGQTMNPSTDDILTAIEKIDADCIYVLPNNKNIILAAQQASELSKSRVIVIPSKSAPQGICAMMAFLPHVDEKQNTCAMSDALNNIKTGQVTYAVRDTSYNDTAIKSGDIIGISNSEIVSVGQTPEQVCENLVGSLADDDSEVITLYYGSDTKSDTAEALLQTLEDKYADCDVILQNGGQPLYYYIVSVE